MTHILSNYLNSIADLQKIIFSIYIARDYYEKHFAYEKRLQEQNLMTLNALYQLRMKKTELGEEYFQLLQQCYDVLMEISTLRYRLKDHALLEMCYQEFSGVSESITKVIGEIEEIPRVARDDTETKDGTDSLNSIQENIFSLETIFQNALQVALPDPLVFLIFIENLFSLHFVLEKIRNHTHAIS